MIFFSFLFYSKYELCDNYNCGVKEFGHPGPLYTRSKVHAEEEEMSEGK